MVVKRDGARRSKGSNLGFKFKRSEGQERHVREKVKKAIGIMDQVWEIGKRRFERN